MTFVLTNGQGRQYWTGSGCGEDQKRLPMVYLVSVLRRPPAESCGCAGSRRASRVDKREPDKRKP